MKPFCRAVGVGLLSAALLTASAGLCFCGRGSDAGASRPGHGCCHPAGDEDALAVRGIATCCHIESAQRDVTPTDAVTLTGPVAVFRHVPAAADEAVTCCTLAPAATPSPPVQVLRL